MFRTEHYRTLLKIWLAEYHKLHQNKSDDTHKLLYLKAKLSEYILKQASEAKRYSSVAPVQLF